MAERQCQAVDQDNTDSHIKVKNECTSSEGSSSDAAHPGSLAPR